MKDIIQSNEVNKMTVGIIISEHEDKLYEASLALKKKINTLNDDIDQLKRGMDKEFEAGLVLHNPEMDFKIDRIKIDDEGEVIYRIGYTIRINENQVMYPYEIFRGELPDLEKSRLVVLVKERDKQRALLGKVNHDLNNIGRKERKVKAALDRELLEQQGISLDRSVMALLERPAENEVSRGG